MLVATMLKMGLLSTSALTTPFVLTCGGAAIHPYGRNNSFTGLPALHSTSLLHTKFHTIIALWKPVGAEELKK